MSWACKVLRTQSATNNLTLNPSVGHYKVVPALNETPHNKGTWGSGSTDPRFLTVELVGGKWSF